MFTNEGKTPKRKHGQATLTGHVGELFLNDATPKEIVEALCPPVESYEINTTTKDGVAVRRKMLKTSCPKPGCRKRLTWQQRSGFNNPFTHLCACYGRGNLMDMYKEAKGEALAFGGETIAYFACDSASPREKAIIDWVELIVMNRLPITAVEDKNFRSFSKHKHLIGVKVLKEVLFTLVELVEAKIAEELAQAGCGALMHDAWTKANVHYMAFFACYMKQIPVKNNGVASHEQVPMCTLVSVAPMASISEDDDNSTNDDDETAKFDAKTMRNHITNIMRDYYSVDLTIPAGNKSAAWLKCAVADNASVNLKLAELLQVPHVACSNHALALDMKDTVSSDGRLEHMFDLVNATMKSVKGSSKNAALLRNLTKLTVKIDQETRWSAKYEMLLQFTKLRPHFVNISANQKSSLVFNDAPGFARAVVETTSWMEQVNVVTLTMQKHLISLASCMDLMNDLQENIDRHKEGPRAIGREINVYKNCPFKRVKSRPTYEKIHPQPNFLTGVQKIQKGEWRDMTEDEKVACASLLKVKSGTHDVTTIPRSPIPMASRIKQRQQDLRGNKEQASGPYVNCNFIFGSAAQVEWLWSLAKYILTDQRQRMTPLLFESLLFLKVNRRFWDGALVIQAIAMAKSKRVQEKLDEETNQENGHVGEVLLDIDMAEGNDDSIDVNSDSD